MAKLAALIRQKHPGAYDDMDDAELESKVLEKYPQYADLQEGPEPKTIGELVESKAGPVGNAIIGYVKEAGKMGQGAGKLVNSATGSIADLFGRQAWAKSAGKGPVSGGISDAIMPGAIEGKIPEFEASNSAQKVGGTVADLGAAALTGGSGGILPQAAKSGLVAAAQSGEVGPEALMAALAGGAAAGVGKGATSLSKLLENNAAARAVADAAGKTGLGAKELVGGALGAYQGRHSASGAALGAVGGATGTKGLGQLLTTPAGQRLFASILAKIGAASGGLAPLAGAGGAALGRAMARLKGSTIGSTEYARDER